MLAMPDTIRLSRHPLAAHLLTALRDERTEPERFRAAARTLTTILVLEATAGLPLAERAVTTPVEPTVGSRLAQGLAAVPILRAGLAMLEPVLALFPDVAVGYVGLERDEATGIARSYYSKLPRLEGRTTLLLDPMLATGGSAAQAVDALKAAGAGPIVMVAVVAARPGFEALRAAHPEVPVHAAAMDPALNPERYIVPGLGDFGDRLYGTF